MGGWDFHWWILLLKVTWPWHVLRCCLSFFLQGKWRTSPEKYGSPTMTQTEAANYSDRFQMPLWFPRVRSRSNLRNHPLGSPSEQVPLGSNTSTAAFVCNACSFQWGLSRKYPRGLRITAFAGKEGMPFGFSTPDTITSWASPVCQSHYKSWLLHRELVLRHIYVYCNEVYIGHSYF